MTTAAPSVFQRTLIAFGSFRRIFKDPDFAQAVAQLATNEDISLPAPVVAPAPAIPLATAAPDAALLLLGLLQREGRLVDFLHENIQSYSDQEVGAAARVVHHGCQRVLHEYLTITPVRDEPEGSRVTLQRGFDASAIRPTGQVVGEPPFTGTLLHRGWRVADTRLPQLTSTHDLRILAAAEVEL
ncbi:DUF2760 domain-containing protein [Chromatium okenii]|uniref:DUF2760 domain-containing protein n=1 Tax=Chromatium okenii TaxID=61644 RepID=UPI0026F10CF7|nr:DUF2760 domain-containing protein [Chromatium okenii]MBV5308298.1 DUF2760 domain-containing protein [Chromatium okenii]